MSCDTPRVDLCLIRGTTPQWTVTFLGPAGYLEGRYVSFVLRTEEELDAPSLFTAEGSLSNSRLVDPIKQIFAHDVIISLDAETTRGLPGEDCWYAVDLGGDGGESIKRQIQGRMRVYE